MLDQDIGFQEYRAFPGKVSRERPLPDGSGSGRSRQLDVPDQAPPVAFQKK